MNTFQRQALRLKVLQKICIRTNYGSNTMFYGEDLLEEEPPEIHPFIESALFYLLEEGYISGNTTTADNWDSKIFLNGNVTSKGIKIMEFCETQNLDRIEQESEFSGESAKIFLNILDSNLIFESQNVIIGDKNEHE